MTTRSETGKADPTIESRDDLLRPFLKGEKPKHAWRIGTEHEKFVYRRADHRAPSYDEPGGIRDLLNAMTEFGWEPVEEGGKVIALSGKDGNVSLEPAGQFELSGAPLEHLHQTCAEAGRHLEQVKTVGERLPPPPPPPSPAARTHGRARAPARQAAAHAEGALCDHASPHAPGRKPRARHDAQDLHDPGQSRLFVRSRHGAEVPRRPRFAAARHRALRQLALHRGEAQRLPLLSQPHLVRHRS